MNRTSNHAFVNQLLVYTLVMICFSGSIGLGTVWMRHQISLTANATKVLDARVTEVSRRVDETTAQIEVEQDESVLKSRNAAWHLGLVSQRPEQFVRITGDTTLRLAAKRNRSYYGDRAGPAFVTLRVAGLTP